METRSLQQNRTVPMAARIAAADLACAALLLCALPAAVLAAAFGSAAPLNDARFWHSATLLPTGKVLVAGGTGPSGAPLNGALASTELYDPLTDTWTYTDPMSTARYTHASALLASGKILVAGGFDATQNPTSSVEIYDPGTNSWTTVAPMLEPRYLPTATLLQSGRVLIVGGAGFGGVRLSTAEVYDPGTNAWISTGALGTARFEHTATLLQSGKVLVAGGETNNSAQLYDPATNAWTPTGSFTGPRHLHQATLLASGEVLLTGGVGGPMFADAQRYDPATGAWSPAGTMSSARFGHSMTVLPSSETLVVGGYNGATSVASADLYDAITDAWTSPGNLPSDKYLHTATLLPSGQVLVAGGAKTAVGALASVELYPATPPDAIAPTASPTQAPAANGAGWNNTDVVVSWNWTDNAGGAGIDGGSCTTSSSTTGEGAAIVLAASCADLAGNSGSASYTAMVDKTNPTVVYTGNAGTYGVSDTVNIACSASDTLSGVATSTCSNISGPAYSFGLGMHSFAASATDVAGNGGTGMTTFDVVLTPSGLDSLIVSFFGGDSDGANGLIAKAHDIPSAPNANAKAGRLNAFNNQVDAKLGNPLTAAQAALLKQLAAAL